ncbi:TetR/AcrR family transcriptional regulator [Actinosynnema sp. NPDC020468]|uniref:TetR/AcrR family transcriptional regulator n=1 Tax=Actinosynnema sp. NPDC020468 TaxID=3154488 RepID=UPI0033E04989
MTTTRDRLLEAAADLLYREGVNVGVDALCKAAGVSKRSMYLLFEDKDALIAASLDRSGPRYTAALLPPGGGTPRERVLHVFRRVQEVTADPEHRGCPLVATAVELKDPLHPASAVARRHKATMTEFFRAEAAAAGVPDPDLLATQLTFVFDGATTWSVVRAEPLADQAVTTAATLLDAAGLR